MGLGREGLAVRKEKALAKALIKRHPDFAAEARNRGVRIKPESQSEDDRTSRGIFKNSSVGLCGDSKELNNGPLENYWRASREKPAENLVLS